MPSAGTNVFAGLRPKVADHLLNDANASLCENVYLVDGRLQPLRGRSQVGTFPHEALTIYKWEDEAYWMSWDQRVHIARSSNPAIDRIYVTGDGAPQVGDVGTAPGYIFNGPQPYPNNMFLLGVPAPGNAPTMVVTVLQPDGTRDYSSLDLETRYYAYTYINEWGEESARSPISAVLECYDDSHVTVNFTPPGSSGGYKPIAYARIYRTNTGTDATAFQYVKDVAIAAGTTLDTVASANLAEVAETFDWVVPPVDLTNITLVGDRMYAGISGREVCFTPVGVPYAWPAAYRFPVEDEPVGQASNGVDLVVLTRGRPVVFVGNNPQAMQPTRLSDYQPCMNERSITVFDGMVVYASPDGIIGISSSQGYRNLTDNILTREQWNALEPATMRMVPFESFLYVASDVGAWLFDIAGGTYTPVTEGFDAAYYDGYEDILYLSEGDVLYACGLDDALTYDWYSKQYNIPQTSFARGCVHAESYEQLHFELYVDGNRALRWRVDSHDAFALPPVVGRNVVMRLTGTDVVRAVSVATDPTELIP